MKSRSNFDHSLAEKNIKGVNEDLWKVQVQDSLDQRLMNVSPFKDFGQNETCELGQIWTLLS